MQTYLKCDRCGTFATTDEACIIEFKQPRSKVVDGGTRFTYHPGPAEVWYETLRTMVLCTPCFDKTYNFARQGDADVR